MPVEPPPSYPSEMFDGAQDATEWLDVYDAITQDNATPPPPPLADNVRTIFCALEERLGEKWRWTSHSFRIALEGMQGEFMVLYPPSSMVNASHRGNRS